MNTLKSTYYLSILFVCLWAGSSHAASGKHPVVIELYTSQGCSSCPPADALLSELAKDPNIIPLSCHVTYWNYIGWDDPYSLELCDKRQLAYSHKWIPGRRYTPQAIVQGVQQMTGSSRASVLNAVKEEAQRGIWITPEIILHDDGTATLTLPANAEATESTLLMLGLIPHTQNRVTRGENRGNTLSHSNSIQTMDKIGTWKGESKKLTFTPPKTDAFAVLIQAQSNSRFIGGKILTIKIK